MTQKHMTDASSAAGAGVQCVFASRRKTFFSLRFEFSNNENIKILREFDIFASADLNEEEVEVDLTARINHRLILETGCEKTVRLRHPFHIKKETSECTVFIEVMWYYRDRGLFVVGNRWAFGQPHYQLVDGCLPLMRWGGVAGAIQQAWERLRPSISGRVCVCVSIGCSGSTFQMYSPCHSTSEHSTAGHFGS